MSFFKSLFLAIIATLFLTYVLGVSFIEMLDVDIYVAQQHIEPLKAISVSAVFVVLLVVVALAIVLSVFGTIIFISMLLLGGIAMVVVGVFWPVFFIALAIWLLSSNKRSTA
jgi:hypothetical protein